jgi:predicted phage terminase large subunit-like protein
LAAAKKRIERDEHERLGLTLNRAIAAKRAADSLIDFTRFMMPDPADMENPEMSRYLPAAHHRLIAENLEKVDKGEILRLIITMPPRHGKSQLASAMFPAWFAGRDPYREVIFATYNQDFAEDFGRKVRDVVMSDQFTDVFPNVYLKRDSKAADRLQTTDGGSLFFAGVGGAITGRGADLFVIDDPFKNREDAESATNRNNVWNWFTSTAYTRLLPGGRIVIILTRWHEDDLVGRIFNPDYVDPEEAKTWKVLSLPAIKDGQALWPERYPIETLNSIRRTIGSRDWSALYMQTPTPDDGQYFLRSYFKPYQPGELPRLSEMNIYAASDHAVGTQQQNDASVLGCVGVDAQGDVWILPDVAWGRFAADQQVEAFLDQLERNKPIFWWAEKGHISQSIGPFLRERMREEQIYGVIDERTPAKDKLTRARSIMARAAMRPIRVPTFVGWWPDALEQLLKFPNAKHDDFVDWLAWIGIGLDSVARATPKKTVSTREYRVGSAPWVIAQGRRDHNVIQMRKRTAGW